MSRLRNRLVFAGHWTKALEPHDDCADTVGHWRVPVRRYSARRRTGRHPRLWFARSPVCAWKPTYPQLRSALIRCRLEPLP